MNPRDELDAKTINPPRTHSVGAGHYSGVQQTKGNMTNPQSSGPQDHDMDEAQLQAAIERILASDKAAASKSTTSAPRMTRASSPAAPRH